jgi:hypothetical protein
MILVSVPARLVRVARTIREEQHVPLHGAGAIVGHDEVVLARRLGAGRCLAVDELGGLEQNCKESRVGVFHF